MKREHGLTDAQVFALVDALGCVEHLQHEDGEGRAYYVSDFAGIIAHVEELHVCAVAYDRLRAGEDATTVYAESDAERERLGLRPWRAPVTE